MADHFSGPRALADPASDITDVFAFPSPERPSHLVLVLDVFPVAAATALFSDARSYRLRLRSVTAPVAGGQLASATGAEDFVFDFRFAIPDEATGSLTQAGTCITPGGVEIPFRVGEETHSHGLRLFAGARMDPFFLDLAAEQTCHALERLAFRPDGVNTGEGANVLSIVLELDTVSVLGPDAGPLLGVVGETVTAAGHPVRLERMGRPEIKNFILQDKKFDAVNHDLEIRDLYNAEDAFSLSQEYIGAYRARLNANLPFFDRLDGRIDWPPDDQGAHPLTELLLADFLVVDVSKPFSDGSFLEIERAWLSGSPHMTCGGRAPDDDIVDELYTLLVGGLNGPRIGDGVDRPTRPASRSFPYLVAPNPDPPDLQAVLARASAPPEGAASSAG